METDKATPRPWRANVIETKTGPIGAIANSDGLPAATIQGNPDAVHTSVRAVNAYEAHRALVDAAEGIAKAILINWPAKPGYAVGHLGLVSAYDDLRAALRALEENDR